MDCGIILVFDAIPTEKLLKGTNRSKTPRTVFLNGMSHRHHNDSFGKNDPFQQATGQQLPIDRGPAARAKP